MTLLDRLYLSYLKKKLNLNKLVMETEEIKVSELYFIVDNVKNNSCCDDSMGECDHDY